MAHPDFATLADRLPLGRDPASVRRRIEAMEQLLEGLFTIPGTNRKVGLDVILDLIPIGGRRSARRWAPGWSGKRAISACRSGRWRGCSAMSASTGLLGLIPLVGAVPDFFFRSNTRNLRIIKRHLDKHHPSTVTIDRR